MCVYWFVATFMKTKYADKLVGWGGRKSLARDIYGTICVVVNRKFINS